jgi:hypothetical protein
MKRLFLLAALSLLTLVRPALAAEPVAAPSPALDPRLANPAFQYEVLRYIYLWYLDDRFFVNTAKDTSFELWIRELPPHNPDPGDESRYAEIWMPSAQLQLRFKLADYPVAELSRRVKSPGYRIIRAAPLTASPVPREKYTVFSLDRDKVYAYLLDARNRPQAPDAALRQRLKAAMLEMAKLRPPSDPTAPQVFFLSNVSPVSGDLWVLWVNEKTAIRLGGEFGADEPDLLALLPLHTQLYDLKRQVVASLLETEGSTGFITKDWTGRILYQCLVLGERVEVPAAAFQPALPPAPKP